MKPKDLKNSEELNSTMLTGPDQQEIAGDTEKKVTKEKEEVVVEGAVKETKAEEAQAAGPPENNTGKESEKAEATAPDKEKVIGGKEDKAGTSTGKKEQKEDIAEDGVKKEQGTTEEKTKVATVEETEATVEETEATVEE
ncbi:hypothetical protein MNBD_BACTEROID01-704, partial [hydrothermal vent metagenome]